MARAACTIVAFVVAAISAVPALAAPACKEIVNGIVQTATRDVLKDAVANSPELQKLSEQELVLTAGKTFLTAERPDFKAYGYMMLLWYGGKQGQELFTNVAPTLDTEVDRAHYYFVLGLYQMRAATPKVAATGRDYVRQMRDSGKVTFVPDDMWRQLIDDCSLP
jgi:hypothetical protein